MQGTGADPIPNSGGGSSGADAGADAQDDGGGADPGVDAFNDGGVEQPGDVGSGPDASAGDGSSGTGSGDAGAGGDAATGEDGSQGGDTPVEPAPTCTVPGRGQGECLNVADCSGDRSPTPGYCLGLPADVQCCTTAPAGECDPDAMPQPNGDLTFEMPGDPGCPDGMAAVDGYCVDRYEGSLVEIFENGDEAPWSPYFNPGDHRVRAVSVEGAVPQGYISGTQAAAACEEAGKRLCTDAEWLRACNHGAGWDYPYGPDKIAGNCNEDRAEHPAHEYFGTWDDWIWSALGHPCLNQLPSSEAPAGEYAECVSPEGVYDLVGNLHEWTADPAGTFRGGFYVDTVINGVGCAYRTTAHNTEHWDYSTGFRCCADAE